MTFFYKKVFVFFNILITQVYALNFFKKEQKDEPN